MERLLGRLDGLLISNPTNILYLTGFEGANPEEHEVYLLLTKTRAYVFTNSLYLIRAKNCKKTKSVQNNIIPISVIQISRDKTIAVALSRLLKKIHVQKIGFEGTWLTVSEYKKIRSECPKNIQLVPAKPCIEEERKIKTTKEMVHIQKACALTDACFTYIQKHIHEGVSETDIAFEIQKYFHTHGATIAFDPVVAFGRHAAEPHAIPSPKRYLQKNESVLIDFGATIAGYRSDMTRMIPAKNPTREWLKAYKTVLNAQQAALSAIKNGERSGAKLDALTKQSIKKAGFVPYSHSLGHGVGLSIHENPRLTIKKDQTLQNGMVVSIEPGIYIEGKFGIRIEDLILIGENGYTLLTTSSKKLL